MRRKHLLNLIYFTTLLMSISVLLSFTACSKESYPEPTPEHFHADTNMDGICEGCLEALDYLFDKTTNTYTVYTAEGLYIWHAQRANLIVAKDIALPSEMNFDLDYDGIFESNWQPKVFQGLIDGKGHRISNLVINNQGNSTGFIGQLETSSNIQNLHFVDAFVQGANNVGCVVGACAKNVTITGCTVSGTVIGNSSYTGGIIGQNYGGIVIACGNNATVSGDNSAGGIVGIASNGSKIIACYNTGTVQSIGLAYGTRSGGIAGTTDSATITACYSTGTILRGNGTNPMAGGIAGYNNGTFSTNYWSSAVPSSPEYGLDHTDSNENAEPIDGNSLTWASAMEKMNNTLADGNDPCRYVENTDTDSSALPLLLQEIPS